MSRRLALFLATAVTIAVVMESVPLEARGGGRGAGGGGRGGGGGRSSGGGSYSRPSGGGSHSRPSSGSSYSRPSTGSSYNRPSTGGSYSRPSTGSGYKPSSGGGSSVQRPSQSPSGGGRVPSTPSTRPSGGGAEPSTGGSASQLPSTTRPGGGGGASQLPSKPGVANRPSQPGGATRPSQPGVADRPSQLPSQPGGATRPGQLPSQPGGATRPGQLPAQSGTGEGSGVAGKGGTKPAQRPSQGDLNNFLGIAGGAAASQLPAIAGSRPGGIERPGTLPAQLGAGSRPGAGGEGVHRPEQLPARPEQRPNWGEWSQNRGEEWHQRVGDRHGAWNNWQQQNQQRLDNFQNNRQQRWDNMQTARNDRQNWRNQNREDWQEHRRDMWDYRFDRADEVWDHARDFYDDVFDDRWWGRCGWVGGYWGFGHYPVNPWWWWRPCAWLTVSSWIYPVIPAPVYVDYGMTVIYEDETVYVDNQPFPVSEYTQPIIDTAASIEQAPPPTPPVEGKPEQWLPLGIFALVQEESGDPTMFFQISVNKEGLITGGYQNTISGDERPITGQVDKKTQICAWRIGDNRSTICTTNLANFTQDVATVTLHYGGKRTETWLLVRMHEPTPAGQPAKIPQSSRTPPPIKPPSAQPK
jgi:hypothetical protein